MNLELGPETPYFAWLIYSGHFQLIRGLTDAPRCRHNILR